jgi:putative glycosyltransferase (TIGR04372 family)
MTPFGFFFAILIRIIQPWIVIRIDILVSDRLGHFAANTELYLCERDAGYNVNGNKYYDIWYHNWPISNKQLATMWGRILNIWPSILMYSTDKISRKLPYADNHIIPANKQLDRDVYNLLDQTEAHLKFTKEEEQLGRQGLVNIGIQKDKEFICLNVRDSSYLDKALPWKQWDYHDYRDSDVNNYISASNLLTQRGYYVIRMGASVSNKMKTNNSMIIDYATNGMRNDFMDIYLGAKCKFCISTSTGFDAIPVIFRRPVLYTDFVHIELFNSFMKSSMTYFKHHYLINENRYMKLSEILESGAGRFYYTSLYNDYGIKLINNSPDELESAVLEMDDRLNGVTDKEYDYLQKNVKKWYSGSEYHGEILSRISTKCLLNDALL